MVINCPICNSNNLFELRNYKKNHLSKCLNCSLVFSNKKPTKEEINDVYSNYNYENHPPTEITKLKIKEITEHLFFLNKPNNVLDVGCGQALFLDEFKKLGCTTFATEFDNRLSDIARKKGHLVVESGLYPKFKNKEKMDMIIFTEVIEHITEQRNCLPHFHNILSDEGIIYITTPNFSSLERKLFKEKWEFICYPEHLCYFTVKTLDSCMNRFGFKKIYSYTENISIAAVLEYLNNSKNSIGNDKQNFYQKVAFESKLLTFIKSQVNFLLRHTNLGMRIYSAYKKI